MGVDDVGRATARSNLHAHFSRSGQYDCVLDGGAAVPSDGGAGWAGGSLFIKATDSVVQLCVNTGTAASCNFEAVLGAGKTVPTDGTGSLDWAQGALFIHTDATTVASAGWLMNIGSAASANFDKLTPATT